MNCALSWYFEKSILHTLLAPRMRATCHVYLRLLDYSFRAILSVVLGTNYGSPDSVIPFIIIIIIIIIIIGIQPLGRFGQRPELSQATVMALVRCILGKFLGVVCHCFPPIPFICYRKLLCACPKHQQYEKK